MKHNSKTGLPAPLEYSQLASNNNTDGRAPLADVSNAPVLFGDPFGDVEDGDLDGDIDYGDLDLDGDIDYGDVDSLSPFQLASGDPDFETGAPRIGKFIKKHKKPLMIGGALAAGTAAALIARRAIKKARARKAQDKLQKLRLAQSVRTQGTVRKQLGATDRKDRLPFFQLAGAKLNAAPIDPQSSFMADMFKQMLDRQAMDTPFYQETAIGTFLGATWTATTVGVATNRFFTGIVLQIGTNALNASPGTVIEIQATIPTIAGNLVIAAQPILLTYEKGYDVRFMIYPWNLVSNKPLPVLGQYNNANPITFTVNGLPAQSAVNLVVPGSLHPWTVAMRNSLLRYNG